MAQKRHTIQVSKEALELVKASADDTGKTMMTSLDELLGIKDVSDVQSKNPTKGNKEKHPWARKPPHTISDAIILCAWREEALAYQNDNVTEFIERHGSIPWTKEGYGLRTFDQLHKFHWFAMKKETPFTTSKAVEKVSWYGLYKKGLFKVPFAVANDEAWHSYRTDSTSGGIMKTNEALGIDEEAQKLNKYYKLIETRIANLLKNKIIERNHRGTYKLHLDSLTVKDWALLHGIALLPPSKDYRLPPIANLISR